MLTSKPPNSYKLVSALEQKYHDMQIIAGIAQPHTLHINKFSKIQHSVSPIV